MEMQQLRYVVAVARAGNFSRAAEQCHVSQPSLSQQIQKLEDELGERLFDRMKREVKLTSHGKVFLRRASASSKKWTRRNARRPTRRICCAAR